MEGPGLRKVENELKSYAIRTTKEGKKYSYHMKVLQEPQQARACGSGAKSSADRRPVDPPPIVELKIFEEGNGEPRDVTFSMSANYFVFATLEQARNVAHGRVAQDQRSLTVLTGTPVAGMVYLDRPTPAGYFIFADLSVRHEGKYRLSFSLYEELKDSKDEDQTDEGSEPNGAGDAHVTHRLEVRSAAFTVFSAKKFPGLSESTSLSRMVAEQGCRVRIRRDVRMRRHPKSGKDWEGYEEETAEARARMSQTPDPGAYPSLPPPHSYMDPIARPRSSSNVSHHSLAPSLSVSRRPSLQDMNHVYHQPAYSSTPHTPQSAYPQSSPYGPSPSQGYAPSPFMHQQPTMQPPPPQYQQQTFQQPPPLPQVPPTQQAYYSYGSSSVPSSAPQPHYTSAPPSYDTQDQSQRTSIDSQLSNGYRRPPIQYGSPPPLPAQSVYAQRPAQQKYSDVPSQSHYQPPAQPTQLAFPSQHSHRSSYGSLDGHGGRPGPPEPVQPPTRPTFATPPLSGRPSFNDRLPPLNTTLGMMSSKNLEPSSPSSAAPQSSYYTPTQSAYESHKRGYGQVFSDRHLHQPLRQGERPGDQGHINEIPGPFFMSTEADSDGPDPHQMKMEYRRADGSQIQRGVPTGHYA